MSFHDRSEEMETFLKAKELGFISEKVKGRYYECHVTLNPQDAEKIQVIADKHKFKTSVLKGDEFMGDDRLMYCTCHDREYDSITQRMESLVTSLLENDISILRKKIEHVILDVRY